MMRGAIKFFDMERGYGFVTPDGGGADVFVHKTVLRRGGLRDAPVGLGVVCEVENSERGLIAISIRREDHAAGRVGDWVQTASGRAYYPLDPREEDIDIADIADIAAGLSRLSRFAGQLRDDVEFYSVAEHSFHLSTWFSQREDRIGARYALLHDALEAYLGGDIVTPVKSGAPYFVEMEKAGLATVFRKFGLDGLGGDLPARVKSADARIRQDERAALLGPAPMPWNKQSIPLGVEIKCWTPRVARAAFLAQFDNLFGSAA